MANRRISGEQRLTLISILMDRENQYIAILPARSGSKRLPGKNLLEIAGKPLIAWSVEAALESGIFDRVIVSSDSVDIAQTAVDYGAEAPFLRPSGLSADDSSTVEVLIHALEILGIGNSNQISHVACLQPTSPLRTADDIIQAKEILEKNSADAVISVCKNEHSPMWSNILPEDNSMEDFLPIDIQLTPSQFLPQYYRLNGAIYLCDIQRMIEETTLFLKSNIYAYVMSRKNSIDIDDEVDFDLAEIYLSRG